MKDEFKTFSNDDFGTVRTLIINDELWFVAKDIVDCLGYSTNRNVIANYIADEDKKQFSIPHGTANGRHNAVLINESGLYSIIFSSKMPKARDFKKWITSKVLPEIRRQENGERTDFSFQADVLASIEKRLEQHQGAIEGMSIKLDGLANILAFSEEIIKFIKEIGEENENAENEL